MAPNYEKHRHDIGLVRADASTQVGLMLAHDQYDKPLYRTIIDKYFPAPRYSSAPDYGAFDPENEMWLIGDDHRSGFGMYIYDDNDAKRYHESFGCDLRFKDVAYLSNGGTAITNPQFPTLAIVNGNMELAATGWTGGNGRSASHPVSGAFSWEVQSGTTPAYQDLAGWDNIYRGTVIKCTCHAWADAGNSVRISITDGTDTTYSSYHSGSSSDETLTVTHKINVTTGSKIGLQMHAAVAATGFFDDYAITYQPIKGSPIKGVDFNDLHYLAAGNSIFKLDATATGLTAVYTLPATITSLAVMTISGTDYLFIAQGLAAAYYYMVAAETFTISTATDKYYQYFCVYNTATPTMAGNDTNSTIRTTVNPLNGGTAWSAQTQVDKDFYDITGLHTQGGTLYISKEDTVYYLNSSGAVQSDLAPELLPLKKSTDNGKNSIYWKDNWYFPWGEQSLFESGSANDFKSPGLYCTESSTFSGQVFAVTGDDSFLYLITDNSTKVEVLAARYETVDGETRFVIHPIQEITLAGCNAAWVSSFYRKSLYIASTDSTQNLYFIPLPISYGDIPDDANAAFATGGYCTTPWLHGNFKATIKAFTELTLSMGHTYDVDIYWTAAYQILGDTTWTTIGNFKGASGNMIETIAIPADSGGTEPVSYMIRFKFTGVTDDTDITPIMLSYHVKATLYPDARNIYELAVRSGDNILDKNGVPLKDCDAAYIRTVMAEMRDATWPQTFYDPWGTSHTVKLLPSEPFSQIVYDEQFRPIEEIYFLRLQETTIHT